jgi:hypothetical protein
MASKQTYECYVCKKAGFADVRVYRDGKTEDGKTIYKNTDMTAHQHKQGEQQQTDAPKFSQSKNLNTNSTQESQQEALLTRVTEESVQRGITASKLFSDLCVEVEGIGVDVNQTRITLENLVSRIDRMQDDIALILKIVYAQTEKQKQQDDHDQNHHTLLDNR